MKLIDFETEYFNVIKDGDFDSLCNLTTITDVKCLSFANNETFVKKACKLENVSCLIVPPECADMPELVESERGVAVSDKPKTAFHMLHNHLTKTMNPEYIPEKHKTIIGKNCTIHPTAHISDTGVVVGDNVVIEENTIIRDGVTIGDNSVIMVGAYIGYSACLAGRDAEGNQMPLLSAGTVRIGKNVQIGAYSAISRGLFPYECAEIGDYSLVGFAVDLSHNDKIGRNVIVLDQSQICGNTVLEDGVHVSPQAVVSNRLRIEEKADVAIGSVVVSNVKKGLRVAGNYAIENSKFLLWHRNKMRTK